MKKKIKNFKILRNNQKCTEKRQFHFHKLKSLPQQYLFILTKKETHENHSEEFRERNAKNKQSHNLTLPASYLTVSYVFSFLFCF